MVVIFVAELFLLSTCKDRCDDVDTDTDNRDEDDAENEDEHVHCPKQSCCSVRVPSLLSCCCCCYKLEDAVRLQQNP